MECLTLKKTNCKNCHKCIRHCPVKSIRFTGNRAYIIENECILCGQCFVVCPQDAKQIVGETEKVIVLIQSRTPIFVSLAPSFAANYEGVGMDAMREGLKKLGFFDAEETAVGATIVKKEYERLAEEKNMDVIITSCCHSINLLIQKYYPSLLPYLADVLSPMQAHSADIKRRYPDAKVVFIGPCVSKKDEAQIYDGYVDAVLTFDELTNWLNTQQITLATVSSVNENSRARFFPTTGGILQTLTQRNPDYTYLAIDGVENCISALKDIENGKVHNCFIEMSACAGSCIGGPIMDKAQNLPVKNYLSISRFAGRNDFIVEQPDSLTLRKSFAAIKSDSLEPAESELQDILRSMGRMKPSDELNCGSCGYNSCREKAAAVFHGKAEISMCLPNLMNKAHCFSETIIRNTPNGLIVVNEKTEVQQINKVAMKILNIRSESHILGDLLVSVLDPMDFVRVLSERRNIYNKSLYLPAYDKYVEETIVYDEDNHVLIGIMRDVTEEQKIKEQKDSISRQTIETTDKVVDKQMRVVQEIASLLGETAAETKIALAKLKEAINNE